MARACIKIYVDDECIRTWGANKSDVTKHISEIKRSDRNTLEEMYPKILRGGEFRYSVLYKKRKHKLYRVIELIDRLTLEEMNRLIKADLLTEDLMDLDYIKSDNEIIFNSDGKITNDRLGKEELLNGYIRKNILKEFKEFFLLESILKKYKEEI